MDDVEMTVHSGSEETGSRKRLREVGMGPFEEDGDAADSVRRKARRFAATNEGPGQQGRLEIQLDRVKVESFTVTCEVQRVEQAMLETIHRQVQPGMLLTGVPLFIALPLAEEGIFRIELPEMFCKAVRDAVRADPSVANLRELHPKYYTLGFTINKVVGDQTLKEHLQNIFQHRLESIIHDVARMAPGAAEHKLTDEELRVARPWKRLWQPNDAGRDRL
eukprot:evm.model.scf_1105.3 EVM.evm.TU.scf_1105.3   scf_1105:17988-23398(-)